MKLLLATLAAATTQAALVAKDRDHYARYWARDHENGRCDAKHCEWMRGLRRESLAEPARAVRRVRARYDIMCFNLRS